MKQQNTKELYELNEQNEQNEFNRDLPNQIYKIIYHPMMMALVFTIATIMIYNLIDKLPESIKLVYIALYTFILFFGIFSYSYITNRLAQIETSNTSEDIFSITGDESLSLSIDQMAEYTHRVWAHWMKYFMEKYGSPVYDGNEHTYFAVPKDDIGRWEMQIASNWNLPEEQKASDYAVVAEIIREMRLGRRN